MYGAGAGVVESAPVARLNFKVPSRCRDLAPKFWLRWSAENKRQSFSVCRGPLRKEAHFLVQAPCSSTLSKPLVDFQVVPVRAVSQSSWTPPLWGPASRFIPVFKNGTHLLLPLCISLSPSLKQNYRRFDPAVLCHTSSILQVASQHQFCRDASLAAGGVHPTRHGPCESISRPHMRLHMSSAAC